MSTPRKSSSPKPKTQKTVKPKAAKAAKPVKAVKPAKTTVLAAKKSSAKPLRRKVAPVTIKPIPGMERTAAPEIKKPAAVVRPSTPASVAPVTTPRVAPAVVKPELPKIQPVVSRPAAVRPSVVVAPPPPFSPPPPAPVAAAPVVHSAPAPAVRPPAPPVPIPVKPTAPAGPPKILKLSVPLTVKELADKLSISPGELIKHLIGMKVFATINQMLTEEPVEKLVTLYGCQYERLPTLEDKMEAVHEQKDDPLKRMSRPPVVTFMGHVDHGKTSLLDAIRETRVVEGEAGGITQHIGAYRVTMARGTITFLDTPGHEAFTAMRARGANVTDIVVLVIAADDGIMPQTKEAADHAHAAGATIVVAMNKIDKPTANADRVKKQLAEIDLLPEDWGGKTIVVPVSAKTGEGIDHLLEAILLEAEVLELKADPTRSARGAVLEGKLTKGGGPVGHLLVQNGTLRVGDVLVSGTIVGKVRALMDARGRRLVEVGPSSPVEVLGLSGVPRAGEVFMVVPDEKQAREIVSKRLEEQRAAMAAPIRRAVSLEEFHLQLTAGKIKGLNLILKSDVQGSLEAIQDAISKLSTEQTNLKFLHIGVGDITEPDILLAEASNAVVIGFNVKSTPEAEVLAKEEQVDVRLYKIIYEAVADVKAALEGLLEPKLVEQFVGRVKVLQAFKVSKVGTIAGSQVIKGKAQRGVMGRVMRGKDKIFEGKVDSLKRFKEDVKEVAEGVQCGIGLAGFGGYEPEDLIELFIVEKVAQRL